MGATKSLSKRAAMWLGIYGPLKRLRRRYFDPTALRNFSQSVDFYREFLSPGDLCFDVGANVGFKSEVFLALGAKVISFEPQPACVRELKARCGHRGLVVVCAAVGSAPGRLPLYIGGNNLVSSLLPGWDKDNRDIIEVPVTTLDQAIKRYGTPRFCKIDVEGYEFEVLKGLSRSLPVLSIEYHLDDDKIKTTIDCVDRLAQLGELEINITLGETAELCWPKWISYQMFRDFFPAKAPQSAICGFGDLFIRIS